MDIEKRDISVRLIGKNMSRFDATLTTDQFDEIEREFRAKQEWKYFEEYCEYRREQRPGPAAPFVDKFDLALEEAIARHTKFVVPIFWPVVDELYSVFERHNNS